MTFGAPVADAGFREARRLFQHDAAALRDPGPPLETTATPPEPPRVVSSEVIESTTVRAHRVFEPPLAGFKAFLDGAQESRVVHYVEGIPIIFGRAAAVVRQRVARRMVTWRRPRTTGRFYLPRACVPAAVWARIVDEGFDAVDTLETAKSGRGRDGEATTDPHPFALTQCALDALKRDRDEAERMLAEEWCRTESEPLFIDGSIATSDTVAASPLAVGVIKSHRTLYVSGAAMRVVQSLQAGHRSSVLRVEAFHRRAVASWYLRVRDTAGHDPLWGLLRVEIALPDPSEAPHAIAARANLISRWILAEAIPLALPDSRWDKMVYGIRDCEEFLRALRT